MPVDPGHILDLLAEVQFCAPGSDFCALSKQSVRLTIVFAGSPSPLRLTDGGFFMVAVYFA